MSVLLLRLAAPLQAWGVKSRFTVRETELAPSKSGVIGLLSAALGRAREDSVEDLADLRFGVRKEQPGRRIVDFHTAHNSSGKAMPLSYRHYIEDAVFLVGFEGDREFLEQLDLAVKNPVYPLFLGRRSCPPTLPITLGVHEGKLRDVLSSHEWEASQWFKEKVDRRSVWQKDMPFKLEILLDHKEDEAPGTGSMVWASQDRPISYSSERRAYAYRTIETFSVEPCAMDDPLDPFQAMEEVSDVSNSNQNRSS